MLYMLVIPCQLRPSLIPFADGLSRLPPIRLKPEDEIVGEKTPRTASFERHDNRINRGEGTRGRHQGSETESIGDDVESSVVTTHTDVPSPTIVLSHEESLAQTHFEPPRISGTITASQDDQHLSPTDRSSSRNVSPVRSGSPRSALPPPTSPTPVSGDIILPLMIFAVVKANPPRLVSNLLYIQRFRRQAASGGEEGYCLINLMAVAEFLENVDLAALGLGESERTVIRCVGCAHYLCLLRFWGRDGPLACRPRFHLLRLLVYA